MARQAISSVPRECCLPNTGYDATSIRAITQAAGVNLGTITYRFGSKEALYEAVFGALWSH